MPSGGVCARSGLSSPSPGVVPGSGGRKRIRTAPSDRGPSRRQRARPPLSTGRPDPFPSPTPRPAGAVWQPCYRTGQKKRLAASVPRPDAGQITAGLNTPASPPGSGPWAAIYPLSHRCQPPGTSPVRHPPDRALATRRRACRPWPRAVPAGICRRTVTPADLPLPRAGKGASVAQATRNSPARWFNPEIFSSNVDAREDYPLHLASGRPA